MNCKRAARNGCAESKTGPNGPDHAGGEGVLPEVRNYGGSQGIRRSLPTKSPTKIMTRLKVSDHLPYRRDAAARCPG
jgi:hypothetical protein